MKHMQEVNIDKITEFNALISGAEHTVIITHTHPDGDAMGSSLGMLHFLKESGTKADIVLNDRFPDTLHFLAGETFQDSIIIAEQDCDKAQAKIKEADLVICLDFNAFSRTDSLENALAESSAKKILIDHHLNPQRELFSLSFSETGISSTCELLYYILKASCMESGKAISIETATALMTGMTTDTNNFSNSVFPTTLAMASELLEMGVDRDSILANLYNNFRENRIRLQGYLLDKKLTITEDGLAYMILDGKTAAKFDIREGETEGFVNLPLAIDKVRMSIFAKEDKNRIRISIRSKKGTSANIMAKEYFYGGGHELASGGKIPFDDGKIPTEDEIASYIESASHKFFNSEKR